MQLYFIRHGQSENNAQWQRTGSSEYRVPDPALTEIGRRQAMYLAEFLAKSACSGDNGKQDLQNIRGFGFTHLYTSLMVRAIQTGQYIADALSLPLFGLMDIHESGGIHMKNPETGESEGLPGNGRSFLQTQYPELILPDAVTDAGWWNRPFEERDARPIRAEGVLDMLLTRHGDSDDRVAMVSHGGFFTHFVKALIGANSEHQVWFSLNNASISRFDFVSESNIVYLNRVDFLPRHLIT